MNSNYTPGKSKQQNTECVQCGFRIENTASFEQVLAGQFENKDNGSFDAVRETPVRAAKVEPDVLVPLFQSLITAIVTTLPATLVAMAFRWRWEAPLAIGATAILVSWFQSVTQARASLVKVERFSYTANEKSIAQVAKSSSLDPIRLEVVSKDDDFKAAMKIIDLPSRVSGTQFVSFCKDILAGKAISRKNWTPREKGFSRDDYDEMTEAMIAGGLLVSLPGEGKFLTAGGKHAVRRMIRQAL